MVSITLYIDTTANGLIAGLSSPTTIDPASLPLFLGDTLNIRVYLLNNAGGSIFGSVNPYTIVPTPGLQLFLYLTDGNAAATIYTQQISWNTDPTGSYFYSSLSLNTAALTALIGTNKSGLAYLKIGYVQNGLQTTVYSNTVQISVGIPSSGLVVPPGLTPLSAEAANNMFVHLDGNPNNPGQGFYLITPNGKKLYIHATDNADGTASFKADPVN